MKIVNNLLNICIGSFSGVFIGHCIYKTVHYYSNPDMYMTHSAPWYTSIQIYGLCTLVVVGICFAIKYIIRRKIDRNK